MKKPLGIGWLLLACAGAAWAGSPLRVPVRFALTNDAGMGFEWFVVGSHPDVGSWNPAGAIKLVYSNGHIWWGEIGVQAGTALEYKFVKRATAPGQICDSGNAVWWPEPGPNLQLQVPAEPPAPYTGKRIEFLSDMTNVTLAYAMLSSADFGATGAWASVAMTQTGPGLRAGEWRHVAESVGVEGEWLRFTFNGRRAGADTWEGAWDGNDYWSPLDALVVRDRQIFNYLPPANGVSASRMVTTNVGSSVANIAGRDIRIYLPRGYDENPDRRYPVVYFSDGQNVFSPSDSYDSWGAETTADAEIRGGRMREAILVGVPCAADRTIEYLPHMDSYGGKPGKAQSYADFLIHNVRPTVDFHFRTKNDRPNTACIGSSSGGLLAMYLGTWTNVFGLVGAVSGVYDTNFCPHYMTWLASARPREARIWMDVGNVGGDIQIGNTQLYGSNFDLYWYLKAFGYVPNADLRFMIGCGHDHNEWAWSQRLPFIYRFLLDVREEPNGLLRHDISLDGGELRVPVFRGGAYAIEHSPGLTNGWSGLTNWPRETRPWAVRTWTPPAGTGGFYRVRGE
jgi:predicted alpha/beta superfamily hydrolase